LRRRFLELVHDVLKVLQRTRQALNSSDSEGVAIPQKVEQRLQLGPAAAARAAGRLGADHLAARRLQRAAPDRETPVEG
jgi:hypothetical protein